MRPFSTTAFVLFLCAFALAGCEKQGPQEVQYKYVYSQPPAPKVVVNGLELNGSPSKGPADAKVTIIESSDFQCPFCSRVVPTMETLLEQYPNDVRVVFKHNPLGFHKRALPAATAAMAAHVQGKFWEYHDVLFANSKRLEDADLDRYAEQVGLDVAKFRQDMKDPQIEKKVLHDQASMVANGARGTPAFFVNGKLMSGAKPVSAFQAEVNAGIAAADALISAGTAVADVHRTLAAKNQSQAFVDAVIDGKPVVGGAAPRPSANRKKAPAAPEKPVVVPVDDSDPQKGDKDAKVTLAIFSDFQCPFCSKIGPTLTKLEEQYGKDIRLVFKQHPLSFHKDARLASKAALAANQQGKFWEYHDVLFANMKALKEADLKRYAQEMGLDMKKFNAALASPELDAAIDKDLAEAKQIGVRGTPQVFVNGNRIKGAQPVAAFSRLIDQELGIKKKSPDEGAAVKPAVNPGAILAKRRSDLGKSNGVSLGLAGKKNTSKAVVFLDLADEFSGHVLEEILALQKSSSFELSLRHFPSKYNASSMARAQAVQALAAGPPEKTVAFVRALYKDRSVGDAAGLSKMAKRAGVPAGKVAKAVGADGLDGLIRGDRDTAWKTGAVASPAVFFNGFRYTGAAGFDRQALKAGLEAAREVR